MNRIILFCFFIAVFGTALSVAQGKVARTLNVTIQIEGLPIDPVLNRTNLMAIQQFILKQGKRQTYSSLYSNNPFYGVDNYFFYLNPDSWQNLNCDPEKSGFHTLVIRNMDWKRDQYRHIEFEKENQVDIAVHWPADDLSVGRIREKTEEALKVIMDEMTRKQREGE